MGFNKSIVLIATLSCLIIHTMAAVQAPSAAPALGGAWRRRINSPQVMVMNLCRNVTNTPLCIKTILSSIKTPFTPIKALETEILSTKTYAITSRVKIQSLLLAPMITKDMNESLSICNEQYGNAIDSIKETLTTLETTNSPSEAKFKLSSVVSYLNTCEDNFNKDVNGFPIATESQYLTDMVANSLDIIKKIEDKEMNRILRRFKGKLPPPPPAISFNNDPCFNVIGLCDKN